MHKIQGALSQTTAIFVHHSWSSPCRIRSTNPYQHTVKNRNSTPFFFLFYNKKGTFFIAGPLVSLITVWKRQVGVSRMSGSSSECAVLRLIFARFSHCPVSPPLYLPIRSIPGFHKAYQVLSGQDKVAETVLHHQCIPYSRAGAPKSRTPTSRT